MRGVQPISGVTLFPDRHSATQFVGEVQQKRQVCEWLLALRIVRDERREALAVPRKVVVVKVASTSQASLRPHPGLSRRERVAPGRCSYRSEGRACEATIRPQGQ